MEAFVKELADWRRKQGLATMYQADCLFCDDRAIFPAIPPSYKLGDAWVCPACRGGGDHASAVL